MRPRAARPWPAVALVAAALVLSGCAGQEGQEPSTALVAEPAAVGGPARSAPSGTTTAPQAAPSASSRSAAPARTVPGPLRPEPVLPEPVLPAPVLPVPVLPVPVLPVPVLPVPVLPTPTSPGPASPPSTPTSAPPVTAPSAETLAEQGGDRWAVYLAVGSQPDDPDLLRARTLLQRLGVPGGLVDVACDRGAGQALGLGPEPSALAVAAYFDRSATARAFGDAHDALAVVPVRTYCLD